jgi:DNA-binding CsgD family transcriptional regulator
MLLELIEKIKISVKKLKYYLLLNVFKLDLKHRKDYFC